MNLSFKCYCSFSYAFVWLWWHTFLYPSSFTHILSQTRLPSSDVGLRLWLSLVHAAAVCLCTVGMWDNPPSRRFDPPAEEIQLWLQAQALRQAFLQSGHPPNFTRGGMPFLQLFLQQLIVSIEHLFHKWAWLCSVSLPSELHLWPLRFGQPLWWSDRRSLYRTNQIVWDRGVVPLQRRRRGEGEEAHFFSTCCPIPQISHALEGFKVLTLTLVSFFYSTGQKTDIWGWRQVFDVLYGLPPHVQEGYVRKCTLFLSFLVGKKKECWWTSTSHPLSEDFNPVSSCYNRASQQFVKLSWKVIYRMVNECGHYAILCACTTFHWLKETQFNSSNSMS